MVCFVDTSQPSWCACDFPQLVEDGAELPLDTATAACLISLGLVSEPVRL